MRPTDSAAVAGYRQRMAAPEGQRIYKERAATAETVNADLKTRRGLDRLLVRGSDKVPRVAMWSHWKQHELPNFCPSTFAQLSVHARRALKRMRPRPALVMAFWEQAQLFPL